MKLTAITSLTGESLVNPILIIRRHRFHRIFLLRVFHFSTLMDLINFLLSWTDEQFIFAVSSKLEFCDPDIHNDYAYYFLKNNNECQSLSLYPKYVQKLGSSCWKYIILLLTLPFLNMYCAVENIFTSNTDQSMDFLTLQKRIVSFPSFIWCPR